jgi:hypothetical protein
LPPLLIQWEKKYQAGSAYNQSKITDLLFALELDRCSNTGQWGVVSNDKSRREGRRHVRAERVHAPARSPC